MSFIDAITKAYSNYFNFKGRARRKEFWYFTLFLMIVYAICSRFDSQVINLIYTVLALPAISLQWRRLHDIGKSGAWWFIVFTGVGVFVLLAFYSMDSLPTANRYGECPKYMPNN